MHVNTQYQDHITLGNHFQVLQNLKNYYEESRQICTETQTQGNKEMFFAGNTKQRQVSKKQPILLARLAP